jgi:hypothetical protein
MSAERLEPASPLGVSWGLLLATLPPRIVRPGADPWVLYLLDDLRPRDRAALPTGPVVYAAVGDGQWRYAGQSIRVNERLASHRSDNRRGSRSRKWDTWQALLVVPLRRDATQKTLSEVERLAGAILSPSLAGGGSGRYPQAGGSAHPVADSTP